MSIVLITSAAMFLMMILERQLAAHNERVLRSRGAVEPHEDVYAVMRWAYPGCFLIMTMEGALTGPGSRSAIWAGLVALGLAKALKFWAIASLGVLWCFRVLVLRNHPIVRTGPYRLMSHPNYLAVCGELVSFAIIVHAPMTGALSLVGFGRLMRARVRIEERALNQSSGGS